MKRPAIKKRPTTATAKYIRTLTYYDQPQLVHLRKGNLNFLAIAVPDDADTMKFLAVSVRAGDWELYLNDRADLLYLFKPDEKRIAYYFDLLKMKNGEVRMTRTETEIPEEFLPGPRIFASDNTEFHPAQPSAKGVETLYLDGEWDLPELSSFQKKISDVYTFVHTVSDWRDASIDQAKKDEIRRAFTEKPFRGGSSYGSYFDDLEDRLALQDRLRLKSIEKASPGNIKVYGVPNHFQSIEELITNFINNRWTLATSYSALHDYLQKAGLLRQAVRGFEVADARAPFIRNSANALSEQLGLDCFDDIENIAGRNALGSAKIVLALFRRIKGAATFFTQGRASFDRA